jgi:hypothetical protein
VGGVEGRKHNNGPKPAQAKRLHLLRGLVHCSCGARMLADTRISRGQETEGRSARLDDNGDLVSCHGRRVPTDAAEQFVRDALGPFVLPEDVVEAAREDLRLRLRFRAPKPRTANKERARLPTRLANLGELYS